jgi:hypothetical protein
MQTIGTGGGCHLALSSRWLHGTKLARFSRSAKPQHDVAKNRGKPMSDTIELLAAIGQNATLRYASAEELAATLEQAQASAALTAAVASGDSSRLAEEFGHKVMQHPQSSQTGHEDEESGDDPKGDEPLQVPAPEQSTSSTKH